MARSFNHIPPSRQLPPSIQSYFPPTFVHPVLLRFFLLLTGNLSFFAQALSIFFGNAFSVYLFRRLLIAFNPVSDPFFTTALFCVGPLHWTLIRSTATSDVWEISFLFLALIAFGNDRLVLLLISIFLAASTRIESFILYPIFTILYGMRKRFLNLSILSVFGAVHAIALTYFAPRAEPFEFYLCAPYRYLGESFHWSPIHNFASLAKSISDLRKIHAFIGLLAPAFIGAITLVQKCAPLGVFAIVWVCVVSCFPGQNLYRLIVPGEIFAILIGLDDIFATPIIGQFQFLFVVIYALFNIPYGMGELGRMNFSSETWQRLT